MGRFAPKYSADQRQAITRLILDGGKTARQAVELAADGQIEGLEPFTMPVKTAQYLAYKEREQRRREYEQTDQGKAESVHRRSLEVLDRWLSDIEANPADENRIVRFQRAWRANPASELVLRAQRPANGRRNGHNDDSAPGTDTRQGETLAQRVARAQREAQAASANNDSGGSNTATAVRTTPKAEKEAKPGKATTVVQQGRTEKKGTGPVPPSVGGLALARVRERDRSSGKG